MNLKKAFPPKHTAKHFKSATLYGLVLIMGFLCACGGSGEGVVVAGSTSVQPYAEVLAEEFVIIYPDSDIDVQGGGSSAGITAAQTGTADIGMSSRSLKDSENLWAVEIAKDGLAVIVHPNNPINNLDLWQIRDIYSGAITDWSEVGGEQAKIHIIAREEGSGTRSAFEDLVMEDEWIAPKAIVQDSNGAVKQLVSDDKNSIGFISLGLVDYSVKAVTLDDVAPTSENIANGTYSLYRPFLFVSNDQPEGLAKQFVDFTLSKEGRQILINEGLITSSGVAGE